MIDTATQIGSFGYEALPMRVVFAPGSSTRLGDELDHLGLTRVIILCSPEQAETGESLAAGLGDRVVAVLPQASMHVPREVLDRVRRRADALDADGYVVVGGGSAIGLGKALALDDDLPIVAVPTTYAGSEMTPVWGITEDGRKTTGRDPRVLPRSVVYDATLTVTLPAGLSVTSGVNAIAHAVEALYAPDASPILSLMAVEGVRAMVRALPRVLLDLTDVAARSEAQYGAWLCGACLGATTMSLHHKLCHVLGGTLGMPHASTHTVVLPHVMAFNLPAVPHVAARLSNAVDVGPDAARGLWERQRAWDAPQSLRDLGMDRDDLPRVADEVLAAMYANPRPVTRADVERILGAAWAGDPPSATP